MTSYIVTDIIRVNIIHSFAVPPRVKCEQYDGDYTKLIKAIVYNGDVLYDIPSAVRRIVVSGLKPDGNGFSYDCTWSGNTVSFSLMRQMTAVNGDVPCNITMFDSENNQVSSAVFVLAVEKAALPSDVVVSSNDFQTFVDYVQAANLYWQYSKSYAVGNTGIRSGENTDNSQYYAHLARMYKGSPLTAATASAMTDRTRVYVYTGSESGYNNGHWYYYNDSAWVDGGVYNAQGQQTDTELTTPGIAADAKAVGDLIVSVTPEKYGAVGDGETDDTVAVQTALRSGKDVVLKNKYLITTTLFADTECNITGGGTIIVNGNFDGIILGGEPHAGASGWFGKKHLDFRVSKVTENWDADYSGVILKNVMFANISVSVSNFKIGIKILADAFGCSYNVFSNCRAYNNKYGFVMVEENDGWCNQNTFIGGSVAWYHGYASQHSDANNPCVAITVCGNENSFYNFCVDGQGTQTSDYVIYRGIECSGNWCHFDHIRLERVGSIVFSGRWCYVVEPYLFVEYTTISKTYENSVIIQWNRCVEFIAEGEELIKAKTVRSGVSSLFAGYNTSNQKAIDLRSDGSIRGKGRGYFSDESAIMGITTNADNFEDTLTNGASYFCYNTKNDNPAIATIIGTRYNDQLGAQFAFSYSGNCKKRVKENGVWGAWGNLFQSIATTAKIAAKDYGSTLNATTTHASVPSILIVGGNGATAIDMYLCWESKIVKVHDGSTNISITYTKDANKNVSITASKNCNMLFIYE